MIVIHRVDLHHVFGDQKSHNKLIVSESMNPVSKENGQSIIEFLSTITFTLGIFFVFVQLAFNAVDGYLIHYATFMASRTFLVADTNSKEILGSNGIAKTKASEVFTKFYLDKLNYSDSSLKFNFRTSVGGLNPMYVGVYYSFSQKFSPMRIVGGSFMLNLDSESFLGREPTKSECLERVCDALKEANSDIGCGVLNTFFDNGC